MRRSRISLAVLSLAIPFTACALPAADERELAEAIGSVSQAIDGGYLDKEDTAVVEAIRPVLPPTSASEEFLTETDGMEFQFRSKVREWAQKFQSTQLTHPKGDPC